MLARFPVTWLHLAAQRVVFSTLGSAATSLGVVRLIGDVSLLGLNLGREKIVGVVILGGATGLRWPVGREKGFLSRSGKGGEEGSDGLFFSP